MKRILELSNKWYVVVLFVLVFAISILSWVSFAQNMRRSILTGFFSRENAGTVYDDKKERLAYVIDEFDSVLKKVDANWTVYNEGFFSKKDSILTHYVTGEVSSAQVLLGKNGMLFYKSTSNADTIADYEGTNVYTQKELEHMAEITLNVQNVIENRGIKFAIIIAPNKENVYFEYMPDKYNHSEVSRTDLIIQYFQEQGIKVASPKKELIDNHTEYQVYYAYDTHWNQLGAYIGVRESLELWGIHMPELSERVIMTDNLKGKYHYCGEDDLASMVGLLSTFDDEKEYTINETILMEWNEFQIEQNHNQISHFENEYAACKEKIMLVGDSFRSSMIPSLREEFEDVYVVHRSFYNPDMLDEIKPDYLLVEYVERYSKEIQDIGGLTNRE